MKDPKEEGLLPGPGGVRRTFGLGLGIAGIVLLFGASALLAILPRAVPTSFYLSLLALALALIVVAYLAVR